MAPTVAPAISAEISTLFSRVIRTTAIAKSADKSIWALVQSAGVATKSWTGLIPKFVKRDRKAAVLDGIEHRAYPS